MTKVEGSPIVYVVELIHSDLRLCREFLNNHKNLLLDGGLSRRTHMQSITFKLSNLHEYGAAFFDYLALRKTFFVDGLGWDIPHDATHEMDQYDNPTAWYSLVLRDGKVIGGARCQPTTARWGDHTYMLRDAYRGLLGDIPPDVMIGDVESDGIWECTRLVMSDAVSTAAERSRCLQLIVDGLVMVAAENGADRLISLSPLSLVRALRQLGFGAERLGEPYKNEGDGRRYAVLAMPTDIRTVPERPLPAVTHPNQPMAVHAPAVA